MYPHLALQLISTLILLTLQASHTSTNTDQFSTCSNLYSCGENIQGVGYPFWGDQRPQICGLQGFKLTCGQENNFPTINMNTQTFSVLGIQESSHQMTLAHLDVDGRLCKQGSLYNTDLNDALFAYNRDDVGFVNVYYNCPSDINTNTSSYSEVTRCNDNGLLTDSILTLDVVPGLERCTFNITVPVLKSAIVELKNTISMEIAQRRTRDLMKLRDVFKKGFSVNYKIDETYCSACKNSGGLCWSGTDETQKTCLCKDRANASVCTTPSKAPKLSPCRPQNCGNGTSISYPFWIPQQQESYCGFPQFNVTCKGDNPILTISGDDYIVRNISYDNNSILLANAEVFDEENSCPTPLHNFNISGTPFSYGATFFELYFFYNCTFVDELATYSMDCASNGSHHSFAVFHSELLKKENYSTEWCQAVVNAPVSTGETSKLVKMSYRDVLKKGFVLEWNGDNCTNCEKSGGKCGFLNNEFICVCNDQPRLRTCEEKRRVPLKIVIGVGVTLFGMLLMLFIFWIKKLSNSKVIFLRRKTKNERAVEAVIVQYGSSTTKRYSYYDVKNITNSFKFELGKGGFGNVFKGKLQDGRVVAVKVLNASKGNGEEFINEVASIGRTSHVNVVTLLGFCYEGKKRALIYEFMANGSLEKFIYAKISSIAKQNLGWKKLYDIALGIARGLEYLHRGCNTRILHLDIKPHNILLDDDFCPKISDFGLAKLCTRKESIISTIEARGTVGYIAPEVFSRNFGGVSHKSDVYSYGMMILEIVGGRKNIDVGVVRASEIYFPHWIYKRIKLDDELSLAGEMTAEEKVIARKMVIVGLWCIQMDPSQRPSISKVIEMLEGRISALEIPPQPYLCSP